MSKLYFFKNFVLPIKNEITIAGIDLKSKNDAEIELQESCCQTTFYVAEDNDDLREEAADAPIHEKNSTTTVVGPFSSTDCES